MNQKTVRDNLKPPPKVVAPLSRLVTRKLTALVRPVDATKDLPASEIPAVLGDSTTPPDPSNAHGEPQLQIHPDEVSEAWHRIDQLHEERSEVLTRGLSKNELAADLGRVVSRLDEAEAKLARAVEARIQSQSAEHTSPMKTGSSKVTPTAGKSQSTAAKLSLKKRLGRR